MVCKKKQKNSYNTMFNTEQMWVVNGKQNSLAGPWYLAVRDQKIQAPAPKGSISCDHDTHARKLLITLVSLFSYYLAIYEDLRLRPDPFKADTYIILLISAVVSGGNAV